MLPKTLALLSLISLTHAATVTNTDDSGPGSLRQAIADATADETIDFALSLDGQTIALTSGNLEIDKALTITGNLTLDAGELSTIFTITIDGDLTLENLTLTKGTATRGGALYNFGITTIRACTFTQNSSTNHGGAIYNEGTLVIENSTIRDNNTPTRGGAIRNEGNLTIKNSFFSNNTSISSGGAIRNDGTLIVENSTLAHNNSTSSGGGAIYSEGTLTVTNSTIAHNRAGAEGGGIFSDGTITVKSATITANESEEEGGGISIRSADVLDLENSIVAFNFTDSGASNIAGNLTATSTNNFTSGIPLLAPLANYGGLTPTMPPFPDSPVIDSNGTTTFTSDQRGGARIQGAGLDLGATEAGGTPDLITNPVVTTFDDKLSTSSPLDLNSLSLREALTYAASGSTITLNPNDGAGIVFSLGLGQLTLTRPVTINTSIFSVSGSNSSRVLFIPSGITATINSLDIIEGNTESEIEAVGAGIFNLGDLTLNDCTVSSNTTTSDGGGILSDGRLTLNNCRLQNNSADFAGGALSNFGECSINSCTFNTNTTISFGGAIRNGGTLTITDSTFTENTVTTATGTSEGGGAIRNSSGGSLILTGCTFNANTSTISGGALYNSSNGNITTTNSTFTSNSAASGGAIFNSSSGGLIDFTFCTITGNTANTSGGALFSAVTPSNNQATNSILTGNTAPTDTNISGGLTPESANNLTTGNPMLGALANNGGPTFTMLPLAGSPALDSAGPTSLLTDQRNFMRTYNGTSDLGAVELQTPPADFQADSDNDGMKDGLEFALGRDPFSPDPTSPRSLKITSQGIRFGFNSASAATTILKLTRSTDLVSFPDILLTNESTAFDDAIFTGLIEFTDPSNSLKAFYRIEASPRQ